MNQAATTEAIIAPPSRRAARREYRHRAAHCSRLLFVGYLPPGTHIEIRCPACGRIHVIQVDAVHVDTEHEFG